MRVDGPLLRVVKNRQKLLQRKKTHVCEEILYPFVSKTEAGLRGSSSSKRDLMGTRVPPKTATQHRGQIWEGRKEPLNDSGSRCDLTSVRNGDMRLSREQDVRCIGSTKATSSTGIRSAFCDRCSSYLKLVAMKNRLPAKNLAPDFHPNAPNSRQIMGKLGLSFIAVALIAGSLVAMIGGRTSSNSASGSRYLRPVYHALQIYGVFSTYETNNEELTIWGLATNRSGMRAYWKQLAFDDYVPFGRAERNRRLWDDIHYSRSTRDGHFRAWQQVGERIRARHNRIYPADPITKVRYQSLVWPRDSTGFYGKHGPGIWKRRTWTIAGADEELDTE